MYRKKFNSFSATGQQLTAMELLLVDVIDDCFSDGKRKTKHEDGISEQLVLRNWRWPVARLSQNEKKSAEGSTMHCSLDTLRRYLSGISSAKSASGDCQSYTPSSPETLSFCGSGAADVHIIKSINSPHDQVSAAVITNRHQ